MMNESDDEAVIVVHADLPVLRKHISDERCWCKPTVLRGDVVIDAYLRHLNEQDAAKPKKAETL